MLTGARSARLYDPMAEMTQHRAAAPEAFGALFESVFDPAVVIDPVAGRFVAANPAAEALFGYTAADLRALSPADLHPHEIPRLDRFQQPLHV